MMRRRSLTIPILLMMFLVACAVPSAQAKVGARHPFLPEDQNRSQSQLVHEIEVCAQARPDCKLDRHVKIDAYAFEYNMTPQGLVEAIRAADVRDCKGTITSSYIDDDGNIVPLTRACKSGEKIAVLSTGAALSLGCGNKVLSKVPEVVQRFIVPEPKKSCIWSPKIVTNDNDESSAVIIGDSRGTGVGVDITTSQPIIQRSCE